MTEQAFSLGTTYVHLRPDERAVTMEGGQAFWAGIGDRTDLDAGRLLGSVRQSSDWTYWERHPAGDEILVLLSGVLELVLEMPSGERHVPFTAGQTFVVPCGAWHRAIVRTPGELMFITPGAGTEHRPVAL